MVQVFFRSDYSITGKAFRMEWQTLDLQKCQAQFLNGRSGTFSSFNFPYPFPDTVNCVTEIAVSSNARVKMVFLHIFFKDSLNDSLIVELGNGVSGTVGNCGDCSGINRTFVSFTNVLRLSLSRSSLLRWEGFQAYYEEGKHFRTVKNDVTLLQLESVSCCILHTIKLLFYLKFIFMKAIIAM